MASKINPPKIKSPFELNDILQCGLIEETAMTIHQKLATLCTPENLENMDKETLWKTISTTILTPALPFKLHLLLFSFCYPDRQHHPELAPAVIPSAEFIQTTNLAKCMNEINIPTRKKFHKWSVTHHEEFWQLMLTKLNIVFRKKPEKICDLDQGIETPNWLPYAKMNIVESCFTAAPDKTAIIYLDNYGNLQAMSYGELNRFSNNIANSLIQQGLVAGDAIAIDMPMTKEAVAIYLGILKIGGVVVSIADSFSSDEIAARLRISHAKAIFTQDYIIRSEKLLPLYEKVTAANAPKTIVYITQDEPTLTLRNDDIIWQDFLIANDHFTPHECDPMDACNILFSSGTTGDPKAIPWNHTTPIKAASDAFLHQNIQKDDVLSWPTNLGWMMGPWLIFAALINRAAIALYHDAPKDHHFGQFVQDANVTMLGVVPTLVATWRQTNCMQGLNWHSIKVFSSTGECSNADDMLYLMSLANYKPVIEYCGGTEIGGSYLTSTVIDKNYPSLFTTPAMGIKFILLNERGKKSANGEVALIPPSIGLSTQLLNADHHKIYFENMPRYKEKILRRHGDQAQRFSNKCYAILGRIDDTMNLGGIKVSSAEIERVLTGIEDIIESAAIAVTPPYHGPSLLVIYAATSATLDKKTVKATMQERINKHLNPLFRISDVVFINELPKTASNKIMRRVLRKQYQGK